MIMLLTIQIHKSYTQTHSLRLIKPDAERNKTSLKIPNANI
jgi:hypothetical protein